MLTLLTALHVGVIISSDETSWNSSCDANAGLTCFSCMFRDWTWLAGHFIDADVPRGLGLSLMRCAAGLLREMIKGLHRLHRSPVSCTAARVSNAGTLKACWQ